MAKAKKRKGKKASVKRRRPFEISIDLGALEKLYRQRYVVSLDGSDTKKGSVRVLDGGDTKGMRIRDGDTKGDGGGDTKGGIRRRLRRKKSTRKPRRKS